MLFQSALWEVKNKVAGACGENIHGVAATGTTSTAMVAVGRKEPQSTTLITGQNSDALT
jgi:hypothetical protein